LNGSEAEKDRKWGDKESKNRVTILYIGARF